MSQHLVYPTQPVGLAHLNPKQASHHEASTGVSRRHLLAGAATLALPGYSLFAQEQQTFWSQPRELKIVRPQSGEGGRFLFYEQGQYLPDAYQSLCYLFRDLHINQAVRINPTLFDILYGVQTWASQAGIQTPIQLLSGYRSKRTNERTEGAARDSQHMHGTAADIRQQGISTDNLWRMVAHFRGGGVGFYPYKHMVHVDVGRVRHWAGR